MNRHARCAAVFLLLLPLLGPGCGDPNEFPELEAADTDIGVFAPRESTLLDVVDEATRVGPWGGSGGSSFRLETGSRITKIAIRSGSWIDRIEITYKLVDRTYTQGFGGSGGTRRVFYLASDEFITRVKGRAGRYVDRLEFHTNKGRVFAAGGQGGSPFSYYSSSKRVVGFFGRSGKYLDQIGLYVNRPRYATIYYTADTDCSSQQYSNGLSKARNALFEIMEDYEIELDLVNLGRRWYAPSANDNWSLWNDLRREFGSYGTSNAYVVGFTPTMTNNGVTWPSVNPHFAVVAWAPTEPLGKWDHEETKLTAHELGHCWGIWGSAAPGHVDEILKNPFAPVCVMNYLDMALMSSSNIIFDSPCASLVNTTMRGWPRR